MQGGNRDFFSQPTVAPEYSLKNHGLVRPEGMATGTGHAISVTPWQVPSCGCSMALPPSEISLYSRTPIDSPGIIKYF
jgi:hypothetical protein